MCSVGRMIGAALGFVVGGPAGAMIGSTIGGIADPEKVAQPQQTSMAAPSPVVDEAANQNAARVSAVNRRRALSLAGPRSLLATSGGASGDMAPAQVGTAGAQPLKSTLGA